MWPSRYTMRHVFVARAISIARSRARRSAASAASAIGLGLHRQSRLASGSDQDGHVTGTIVQHPGVDERFVKCLEVCSTTIETSTNVLLGDRVTALTNPLRNPLHRKVCRR